MSTHPDQHGRREDGLLVDEPITGDLRFTKEGDVQVYRGGAWKAERSVLAADGNRHESVVSNSRLPA
jgi:hypothetical protein